MQRRTPNQRLHLTPSEWRQVLKIQLIDCGFEQDVAALVARRVIERIVHSYLAGRLPEAAAATHSLDEAA